MLGYGNKSPNEVAVEHLSQLLVDDNNRFIGVNKYWSPLMQLGGFRRQIPTYSRDLSSLLPCPVSEFANRTCSWQPNINGQMQGESIYWQRSSQVLAYLLVYKRSYNTGLKISRDCGLNWDSLRYHSWFCYASSTSVTLSALLKISMSLRECKYLTWRKKVRSQITEAFLLPSNRGWAMPWFLQLPNKGGSAMMKGVPDQWQRSPISQRPFPYHTEEHW